ncbi:transcriptional regulator [Mesorhizobium sp. M4B.F.Ca.ET.190.01.1.1]|uniref:ATP-binding protein n=1 Tax=unclassified Mesorhizobium TaxID=325217 RepID=UPI0010920275|nr:MULTISPECIES: ATP-binding protein [unclassified Mesorhizobium]TGR00835.1 transcriptional regulator [Mesorhizobium sp. M4B.F.Ca.ET.200.01.1.1]TGS12612.1 transcriptional regulator [Mesorhizobium sp. M4B.F.Ca.ET.190.01.1.1]TGT24844.1 transcriptional regulator [Mesorhizobium sp. M4B.F.Ca.ET.172.01.1.1]
MPLIHDVERLVERLIAMPRESEWLEFKTSQFNKETIGKYVSAISNSAILHGQDCGYLIFGVEDDTHAIVGTSVRLAHEKVGNDTFLFWLHNRLFPRVLVEHRSCFFGDKRVEVLAISHGYQEPVKFNNIGYIRVDTSLQPLGHSHREREVWQATNRFTFEQTVARTHLSAAEIENAFYLRTLVGNLKGAESSPNSIFDYLVMSDLIRDNNQGAYDVLNLFVVSAARDLRTWPGLERKGVRVIEYAGKSKLDAKSDAPGTKGYAVTFEALLNYVMERVPHREEMQHGKRVTVYDMPQVAVREILANAIIHQDFTAKGDGPVVEIFPDRLKVTNSGEPLISTDRFIDAPSRSRNDKFRGLMHQLGFCEERGSGIDRAVSAIERAILPPPLFQAVEGTTVTTLYGPRPFATMTTEERIRACYQHACLMFESGDRMSNSTLRARLGLGDRQASSVTAVINDTKDAGLIRPVGEDQANRNARYIPAWA